MDLPNEAGILAKIEALSISSKLTNNLIGTITGYCIYDKINTVLLLTVKLETSKAQIYCNGTAIYLCQKKNAALVKENLEICKKCCDVWIYFHNLKIVSFDEDMEILAKMCSKLNGEQLFYLYSFTHFQILSFSRRNDSQSSLLSIKTEPIPQPKKRHYNFEERLICHTCLGFSAFLSKTGNAAIVRKKRQLLYQRILIGYRVIGLSTWKQQQIWFLSSTVVQARVTSSTTFKGSSTTSILFVSKYLIVF